MHLSRVRMQAFNVLRYELTQHYDAHHDYFQESMYGPMKSNRMVRRPRPHAHQLALFMVCGKPPLVVVTLGTAPGSLLPLEDAKRATRYAGLLVILCACCKLNVLQHLGQCAGNSAGVPGGAG